MMFFVMFRCELVCVLLCVDVRCYVMCVDVMVC